MNVAAEEPFRVITLRNAAGTVAQFMNYGATWLSFRLVLDDDTTRELLLGCSSLDAYRIQCVYMGATVGRFANRIANSCFPTVVGNQRVVANHGRHHLHGGPGGFHSRRWTVLRESQLSVEFELVSADGDQGYPGTLTARVEYRLTEDSGLDIVFSAHVDKQCPVSLTNHAYFNLDGPSETTDARRQRLWLRAKEFLPVDAEGIPTGPLHSVQGTSLDFTAEKSLLQDFMKDKHQQLVSGYDHAFLLSKAESTKAPAAQLRSADGRVRMTLETSAPALHVYTGNFLAGTSKREGALYSDYAGVALESEFLPDSPNHPEWQQPSCFLDPGRTYYSVNKYRFFVSP